MGTGISATERPTSFENSIRFPFTPTLSNLSLDIQAESTVWISTIYANNNSFLLGASSGFIGVNVNGSLNKMTNYPQGIQPMMVNVNNSFVVAGAGVMTDGGIETFRYTPPTWTCSLITSICHIAGHFPGMEPILQPSAMVWGIISWLKEALTPVTHLEFTSTMTTLS
ncbi:MAG: hypothetical protein ACYCSO_04815 [Cuniculiplasma sp.]